tara:strand:- start:3556 stop:3777 length:222 start_codon:yes stop_codon:yes gene_type:complete
MNDTEVLEKRLGLFADESWGILVQELTDMAKSLETIQNIDDEKTLFTRRGQVDILNMMINLQETTKLALDQLD